MKTDKTRFDEWTETVDCNDCARYWDDSCDGMPTERSQRLCTSFLATRRVVIPSQIESLRKDVRRLYALLGVAFFTQLLTNIKLLMHLCE